jgi:hypothetical protein
LHRILAARIEQNGFFIDFTRTTDVNLDQEKNVRRKVHVCSDRFFPDPGFDSRSFTHHEVIRDESLAGMN